MALLNKSWYSWTNTDTLVTRAFAQTLSAGTAPTGTANINGSNWMKIYSIYNHQPEGAGTPGTNRYTYLLYNNQTDSYSRIGSSYAPLPYGDSGGFTFGVRTGHSTSPSNTAVFFYRSSTASPSTTGKTISWSDSAGGNLTTYKSNAALSGIYYYANPPSAPQSFNYSVSGKTFSYSFSGPATDGGSSILGYTLQVQYYDPNSGWQGWGGDNGVFGQASSSGNGNFDLSSFYNYGDRIQIRIAAGNDVDFGPAVYTGEIVLQNVPDKPTIHDVVNSTTNSGTQTIHWYPPTNNGSTIGYYDVYRDAPYPNGTRIGASVPNLTNINGFVSYSYTGVTPGQSLNYYVSAHNELGWSNPSDAYSGPTAYGIPDSTPIESSKTGRNIQISTLDLNNSPINTYGLTLNGVYVQYQTSTSLNGTYGNWSTPQLMTGIGGVDGAFSYSYTYELLTPALWYKFRVYAKNDIINNSSGTRAYYPDDDSALTANFSYLQNSIFVSAGGRRLQGSTDPNPGTFQPTQTAKRFDGTNWVDLSVAKKFNGTTWVDLT
jgi:hypothetical protein